MTTPRRVAVLAVLAVGLALMAVIALRTGAAETTAVVVSGIRAPRIALAVAIGAALGLAGAAMQALLRNPLADPAIVGVSAGAALGAAAAVGAGAAFATLPVTAAGVVGALAAIAVVTLVARHRGRTETVTLVLAGIAVSAFAAALVSVVVGANDDAAVRSVAFWANGSLALATWPAVGSALPWILAGAVGVIALARRMDVLSLGDRAARASGIDVGRTRAAGLAAVAALVAAGTAVAGVIAFVGLVVPHALRPLVGPAHRWLLPASALAGALALLAADTVARTALAPVELPVGAVTALIGGPAFLALLLRTRDRQGGWS